MTFILLSNYCKNSKALRKNRPSPNDKSLKHVAGARHVLDDIRHFGQVMYTSIFYMS